MPLPDRQDFKQKIDSNPVAAVLDQTAGTAEANERPSGMTVDVRTLLNDVMDPPQEPPANFISTPYDRMDK